jgi:hypothetical protein
MLTKTGDTGDIFKSDSGILQKRPKFCDISYDIDGKGT